MGSKRFDGVLFVAYPNDHLPPHVHGFYAETEVIVELLNGTVRQALRDDAIRPPDAKKSDVTKILRTAARHADELAELWRLARG